MNDGLSQNSVQAVIKDTEGFYWIGTQDGLNCFDGKEFDVYRQNNTTNSLTDNFITCLVEDDFGNIWIGTRHCLNRYNKKTKLFTKIGTKEFGGIYEGHNDIKNLQKDLYGNIVYICAGYNLKINKTELNNSIPKIDTLNYRLISEENDIKYIIEENIYYKIHQNKKKKLYTLNNLCYPIVDRIDSITYISLCGNLFALNETKNELNPIHHQIIPKNSITSLKKFSNNKLLIGTTSGLYILTPLEIKKVKSGDENYLLKSDVVVSISITSDSVLWVGTAGHGVLQLN
ncbi:MAG: hypothetical protein LCH32_10165 [Bacteroidetes bacterium]|nr:hypothetical protein [Bacteroidota bacterium]